MKTPNKFIFELFTYVVVFVVVVIGVVVLVLVVECTLEEPCS